MRKFLILMIALVATLGVTASTASAETGVTPTSVTIGGTFPLTGPASLYAPIPVAMKAYFSYINARRGPDGKRGVAGRQIIFKYYDDGYNPANTVQLTRKLVEEDKVFAVVGALGTENNLAIRPYMTEKKVPQILNATGANTFGKDYKTYPWTSGWQPDYEFEGTIYGRAIARNSPNAKIAVLYQDDVYGNDLLRGLQLGLGDKASNIAGKESYPANQRDVTSQVVKLRGSGATVFVVLATPGQAIGSLVAAKKIGWNLDVIYVNQVSSTDSFMTTAGKAGAGDLVNKVYTVQYAKDPANPEWDNDDGMKLYKQVMAKYYPNGTATGTVTNGLNLYGFAVAHAFTQLLYKTGKEPTRQALMDALRNWNEANPFLLPGVKQRTSGTDQFIVNCERLQRFTDGVYKKVSAPRCD